MTKYHSPGVYVEEVQTGSRPIEAVGTSTAAFLGVAPAADSHLNQPIACNNWSQFCKEFIGKHDTATDLARAVYGFFANGGGRCYVVNVGPGKPIGGDGRKREGIGCLEPIDEIALVAAPGYCDPASHETLLSNCEKCGDRVAILDAPATPENIDKLKLVASETSPKAGADEGAESESSRQSSVAKGLRPRSSSYGAFYFPWILVRDPFAVKETVEAPPSGHICGMICRSDAIRGVHKAPANEPLRGALGLSYQVTHFEQGELNRVGVNCIRYFPQAGIRVWGARTLADGDWKYINVRRLCIMIEESIRKQTLWVVFEPNDEFLWGSMKRDIKAFLTTIWRSGGLMGTKAEDAFYVKCDAETNPWESINEGKVVAEIGIAPVRPAEFVIFRIGQSANGSRRETESRN